MKYNDVIKRLAKLGLTNDRQEFQNTLNDYIEYSKQSGKVKLALQLQAILKDYENQPADKNQPLLRVGSDPYFARLEDKEMGDLILERLNSDFTFDNLIIDTKVKKDLSLFIEEHRHTLLLTQYRLPVANKILLHGPSGNGKTLASYVLAGELKKLLVVINLGAIVSAKLGETSKNLAKVFRRAASEEAIILLDELDSIGKIRDYSQDHGEMKRVVNTILQIFDYLPANVIVIAATNQKDMIDPALLRRFDLNLEFHLPTAQQLRKLVDLTLKSGLYKFDNLKSANSLLDAAHGLSYFSFQKTLVSAIKRSLLSHPTSTTQVPKKTTISTSIWRELLQEEKDALSQRQG